MKTPELDAHDFDAFFHAVHGVEPFPWQSRLARLVCSEGWPAALDVPTGGGKTAVIDVAVFHLAIEADRGAARRAPVRAFFVVDRRLVVDDAYGRAKRIAEALAAPKDHAVRRVAERLRLLSERPDRPLVAGRLRGGIPNEPDWIRSPAQPAIIASTVDQVGSRMFFRGYGVSDSMKPLHAGLVGSDALLLLDEAHLSQPFVQSARDARMFQAKGTWSDDLCPAPFAIVTLSATQTEATRELLGPPDRKHRTLGPRLRTSKPAVLVLVKAAADEEPFVAEFVERAWNCSTLGGGPASVVAVVVNRVRRARAVFRGVRERLARNGESCGEAALLTGRSRPIDRDRVLGALLPRMAAQRPASAAASPLFVIATQCIEAGADLDFDALVSEIAPLDSLRQRFGRLNRMGRGIEARAAVVAARDQVAGRAEPDVVYGTALRSTWDLLCGKAETRGKGRSAALVIDFGAEACQAWLPGGEELRACLSPRSDAPVMLAPFVEHWACTSPVPAADAEVALFLHGPEAGPGDAHLVWRADLDPGDGPGWWIPHVAACPPSALEALAVPIGEARRWLSRSAAGDIADVEASRDENVPDDRAALRWRGEEDENTGPVTATSLRPGDLVVVPSAWGGCDDWGWAPDSPAPVRDLAQEANRVQRGRDILRLSPRLLEVALAEQESASVAARSQRFAAALRALVDASDGEILAFLGASAGLPEEWTAWIGGKGRHRVVRTRDGCPLALERRVQPAEAVGDASTEDDRGATGPRAVGLSEHSRGVSAAALEFAGKVGLPARVAEDVALAGLLHDSGKAHPDFKLRMYGGDELAAAGGEPLAKSGRGFPGLEAPGNFPKGARHEVASLALARAHPAFREARDPDLVLWLIGTHHGRGRPFFPPVAWPEPGATFEASIDGALGRSLPAPSSADLASLWLDMHARLLRRYGPWGLARLEAILRLADHRRSEAEQEGA